MKFYDGVLWDWGLCVLVLFVFLWNGNSLYFLICSIVWFVLLKVVCSIYFQLSALVRAKKRKTLKVSCKFVSLQSKKCNSILWQQLTCRCQFLGLATFECLWRARWCPVSHWRYCSCRSWGTEWELGLQVLQPHRYEKSIFLLHIKKRKKVLLPRIAHSCWCTCSVSSYTCTLAHIKSPWYGSECVILFHCCLAYFHARHQSGTGGKKKSCNPNLNKLLIHWHFFSNSLTGWGFFLCKSFDLWRFFLFQKHSSS